MNKRLVRAAGGGTREQEGPVMRGLILAGFMASAALLPATAEAQSDSAGAGLSMAAGGQRAAGAMARGVGTVTRGGGNWGGSRNGSWRGGGSNGGNWHGGSNGNWQGNGSWHGDRGGNWHRGNWGGSSWGGGYRGGTRFSRGSRFFVGGFLPSYFLAPQFYITNYPVYGLTQPGNGYRWVRYYDDAYLVDGRGYISSYRYGVPYDGGGYGYDDGYARDDGYYRDDREYRDDERGYAEGYRCDARYERRGSGGGAVAGAVAGGVLGGVAGNLIAGRGDRTEGTIIGAGLGAIAGGAVGSAAEQDRQRYEDCYRDDRGGYRDESYGYDERGGYGDTPEYVGNGDYTPPPGGPDYDYRSAGVSYGEQYDFDHAPDTGSYGYDRPAYGMAPIHTEIQVGGGTPVVTHRTGGNGVTQTATTTIVLNPAPATTTTTTFIEEEVEYVPVRRSGSKRLRR